MPAITAENPLALPRLLSTRTAPQSIRPVTRVVTAHRQTEGAGFTVSRPFPGALSADDADPFILLDQVGPQVNAPGEATGAPWHPHRGFETVSYVRDSEIAHHDSNGGGGVIGEGDTQWMTAGSGILYDELQELAPAEAIASNSAWAAHADATQDVAVATPDDVQWADAVIFGSPTRFGNVASQLKQFIDSLGGLWAQGLLADKVYSGFTATATAHGGQESTILALYNSIHHFGGVVVAPGYTDPVKFVDGNPYGTSHVNGQGAIPVDDNARNAGAYQGQRVAKLSAAVKAGLSG